MRAVAILLLLMLAGGSLHAASPRAGVGEPSCPYLMRPCTCWNETKCCHDTERCHCVRGHPQCGFPLGGRNPDQSEAGEKALEPGKVLPPRY